MKFLESGLVLARRALSLAANDRQRYWVHFQVLRRLNDFSQFQRMLDYLSANVSDFPAPAEGQNSFQLQCYCYRAIAHSATGNQPDAINELRALLDLARGNAELEGKFGEILGLFYQWSNDSSSAIELFEWVAQNYPTHSWANIGRLELAIQKFKAGDLAAAEKLSDNIISGLAENAKMVWMQRIYWGAVYLRGCCLQAQGGDGTGLKQLALSKVPGLDMQQRLHSR